MTIVTMHPAVPTKNPRIVVYLSAELKADLETLAAKDNRSVSNLLETVAKEIVQKAKQEGRI